MSDEIVQTNLLPIMKKRASSRKIKKRKSYNYIDLKMFKEKIMDDLLYIIYK